MKCIQLTLLFLIIALVAVACASRGGGYGAPRPYDFSAGPYTFSFEEGESFAGVRIVNRPDPSNPWRITAEKPANGSRAAAFTGSSGQPADAWLLSVPFRFEQSKEYDAGFFYSIKDTSLPQKLRLTLGTKQDPEAMTRTLLDLGTVTNTNYQQARTQFRVERTGDYYFGIQAYGTENGGTVYVDANNVFDSSGIARNTGLSSARAKSDLPPPPAAMLLDR